MIQNKKITHEFTTELAEVILRDIKNAEQFEDLTVFAVYWKDGHVLAVEFVYGIDVEIQGKGFSKLIDTSGVGQYIYLNKKLHYKTNLEKYLYNLLKQEELRIKGEE